MRPRKLVALLAVPAALLLATPAQGITNPQIPGLQVALKANGVYRAPIDGIAGPQTARAVRAFQRRAGITVDGIAGPQTRAKLGRLGRPLFGKRLLIAHGMVGWDVSVLEFFLSRRGFPPGAVDGHFTKATTRALRGYQRKKRLAVDGVAGPLTLRAFGVRPPKQPPAARQGRSVRDALTFWARHFGVEPRLVRALAWMESGFQTNVTSRAGAWGVMQVTPTTWRYVETVLVGERVPRTVEGNIRVGVAFLDQLLHEFFGRQRLALGAYYQGASSVRRHGLFPVTRAFAADVLALKRRF